jgi:hypothetical protein
MFLVASGGFDNFSFQWVGWSQFQRHDKKAKAFPYLFLFFGKYKVFWTKFIYSQGTKLSLKEIS